MQHGNGVTLLDTHVHLDHVDFDPDRADVLKRSRESGVTEWIVPATTVGSARALLACGWKVPEIHVAAGIHPHEVRTSETGDLDDLEMLLSSSSGIVAVGETGLDYHYDADLREKQLTFLERHLDLAARFRLPVILHARDGSGASAYADILERIEAGGAPLRGVLHSFTGDYATAKRAIDLGFHIGVGGIITFKKSTELRETILRLPLDRIILETDAPYLAPVPHRGKRNEPAWLAETHKMLAGALRKDAQDIGLLITGTSRALFSLTC
ncbi:MAG: TatD family hydrolase [Candidatus Hydrogenedentota bacterium]